MAAIVSPSVHGKSLVVPVEREEVGDAFLKLPARGWWAIDS